MDKRTCNGCQHDDGNGEHCFFWHIAVKEVREGECNFAKTRKGG